MVGFVNIPINLGLTALQAQTAKAQAIIQSLGASVTGLGRQSAIVAQQVFTTISTVSSQVLAITALVDRLGQRVSLGIVNLIQKAFPQVIQQGVKGLITTQQYFYGMSGALGELIPRFLGFTELIRLSGLQVQKTGNIFTDLANAARGLSKGDPFAAAALGIYALQRGINTAIAGLNSYAFNFNLIFAPITSNFLLLNVIANKYGAGGLTLVGRYTDYVRLAAIFKELAGKGTALSNALDVVSRPLKVARELTIVAAAFTAVTTQIQGAILSVNTLGSGLLASASSLSKGGGFLLPGQLSPGATVYDMFDPQQALESSINLDRLTGGFRAIATVSGASQKQIADVNQEILRLGIDTGQTNDQVAQAATILTRMGNPIEGLVGQLRGLSYTSVATGESIANISGDVLDVVSVFELSANETERVGSLLTQASLESGTAISQYASAIRSMQSVATNSGQSLEGVVTVLASVTNAGYEGASAGETLASVLTQLQRVAVAPSTSNQVGLLSQLGVSQDDLLESDGSLRNIIEIINLLRSKTEEFQKTNGQASTNNLLAGILGTSNAGFVSAAIKNSESELNNLNRTLQTSSDLTKKISQVQGDSLFGNLQKLSDAASTVSTTFGNFLAPIFNSLLGGITNIVVGFAKLPPAVQIGIAAFNAAIPTIFLYVSGVRSITQINKLAALSQVVYGKALILFHATWNTLLRLSTGDLTVTTIATKALAKAQLGLSAVTSVISPVFQSLTTTIRNLATGQATLSSVTIATRASLGALYSSIGGVAAGTLQLKDAFPGLIAAVEKFGAANVKEFLSTTRDSTKIIVKQIGVVLKLAATLGLAYVAFLSVSELFKRSEGAKFAADIDKSNEAFIRANLQLFTYQDSLKIFSNQFGGNLKAIKLEVVRFSDSVRESLGNAVSGFSDLKDEVQNIGLTEAIRQQLEGKDLINLIPPLQALIPLVNAFNGSIKKSTDILNDYGEAGKIVTGAQLGNQQAILAMESQQIILNKALDEGYKLLGSYAVGTKLSAEESEKFKTALTNQITLLEEQKKKLLSQKPPTAELKQLQEAQIILLDKQINLTRGRIKGLSEEGNTVKNIVVPSYDELIAKYQELEAKGKLKNTNRQITIETDVVTGKTSSKDAEEKRLLANRIRINEELKRTKDLRANLEATNVGQVDAEQQKKIQDEINKSIQQEADLRLEAVQNQAKIIENNQQNEIESARVGILRIQSFEKLRQLKLEQDIAAGKIKGNDIEKERGRIQLESLQAQLRENQIAQKRLSGQPGEIIGSDQKKLKDEAIELQSQIAQAQVQEQERVTQVRSEQEQKIRDEQEKTKEAAIKATEERFNAEQSRVEKLNNQSEIKTAKNDFRSNELQAQQQLTEVLSGLDKQRLDFQLELANRSQSITQSEQVKLAIYQQQKEQLALQQQQQQQSIALSREQQQLELERKKLTADLAILEAQANLEKAKTSGASASEIASLESAIAIRQSQRDLINQEAQSIDKVNGIESQRIGIENKIKTEQLEQQRILELQDLAVQRITTSLETQKASIEGQSARLDLATKSLERQSQVLGAQQQLIESNANLERQRLDYQLSLANLTGDFNRIEQTKAGIYLQQREEILRQTEAQQVSVALSKQQQEIELQRQQLQAQSALLEAQANVEKAKAQGVSGQQLAILQQSVGIQQAQLDAIAQQRATSEQVNALESQRATIESQIKLEQLDQQRQLELIEAKAQAIANAFERQREQLDLSSQSLDLNSSRLERQSSLLAAQSGVSEAINERDQQRLNYQLEIARTTGNTTQEEQLKQAIYQQQVQALIQKQAVDRESLKISSEQKAIDLERQKIQAEIALLEAQANIEEAKIKGVSDERLASLQKIAELRAKALGSVDADINNQSRLNQLENQRLSVQQQTALEQLQQSKNLEDLKKQQEALNKTKEDATNKLKGDGTIDPKTPEVPIPSVAPEVYLTEADLKRKPVSGMISGSYPKSSDTTDLTGELGLGKTAADVAAEQQQQLQEATINAQSVYLNGQIIGQPQQPKSDAGKISQPITTDPEARLKAANQAMESYIANFNAEAEQGRIRSGLTAEQATAGGFQQAKLAREQADRIQADLASGRLKTTQGNFTPEQMVTPLQKLQQELNAAQKAVDQKKQSEKQDPAKLYDLIANIYGYLQQNGGGSKVDNLVVISSDPTGDAREVLNQLTRSKRNC